MQRLKEATKRFEPYRGTMLFAGLLCLALTNVLLHPKSAIAWGLFLLWVIRITCSRSKAIMQLCIVVGMITIGTTTFSLQTNQTKLPESIEKTELLLYPASLSINGDQLTGYATISSQEGAEQVPFFYTMKSEQEKKWWEQLVDPIVLSASVQLEQPSGARNFAQFDYQSFLKSKRMHWVATIDTIHRSWRSTHWLPIIKGFPYRLIRLLESRLPDSKTKGYILAMVFNRSKEVEDATMDAYQKVGVIHLFSISGMHIQAILVAVRYLLIRFGVTKETTNRGLLFSILLYGAIIGSGVGIFRAILTNSILLLGTIWGKPVHPLDALSATAIISLWINPYLLLLPAFQLSYLLAIGLCFFAQKEFTPSIILSSMFLSLLLTGLTYPILSYHFFELSWVGFFFNLLVGTIFSAFFFPLFWGFSILAMAGVPSLFYSGVIRFSDLLLTVIETGTTILSEWKGGILVTGRMAVYWYLLVSVGIFVLILAVDRKRNRKWAILGLLIIFFSASVTPLYPFQTVVTVLDIGQGDAILIQQNHTALLIDTGGNVSFQKEEEWQQRASPVNSAERLTKSLKALGVKRLTAVFITHRDHDHLGNLASLAQEIAIDTIITTNGVQASEEFQNQMKRCPNIPIILVQKGDSIQLESIKFQALYPAGDGDGSNNDSLVLVSSINGSKWLFTGDLEEAGENQLLHEFPHLQVDYLKVGHHGSKTSTSETFLNQIRPHAAIVSAGWKNRYGHPDEEVVHRMDEHRVQVYRTDLQGAIQFRHFGKSIEVEYVIQ